ncbi:unnamed protein product, partial [Closterium sp. Naga37s-1]
CPRCAPWRGPGGGPHHHFKRRHDSQRERACEGVGGVPESREHPPPPPLGGFWQDPAGLTPDAYPGNDGRAEGAAIPSRDADSSGRPDCRITHSGRPYCGSRLCRYLHLPALAWPHQPARFIASADSSTGSPTARAKPTPCITLCCSHHRGIAARDPWGVNRVIWPILFSYVADFPETCKVSCTQQHGSAMPCSLCYVDRGQLRNMTAGPSEPRSVDQQSSLLHSPRLARTYSTLCIPSFLWEWNFSRTLWGNTYLSQMPDILHIIYMGFWLYLRAALRGPDGRAATLDGRQNALHPEARQAGLITPTDAAYWVSGANFTASEHAGVMMIVPFVLEGEVSVISSRTIVAFLDWHETYVRASEHTDESLSAFDTATRRMVQLVESTFPRDHSGWNLVKVHLLLHLTEAIRRGGLPREYSAAVYENAHIRTCKRPYRASNHRDLRRVIAQHNTIQALMTRLPTNLEGDRQYNTALRRAIAAGVPQLCRQRSRMYSAICDREQAPLDLYATYDAAIPGGIGPYAYLARLYGYIAFPAWVHTALALPAREMDYTLIRPHYARASASHYGVPAFSFIEYENGSGETVHGRVHLLLTLTKNSEDADPAGEEVAFVRQWYPSQVDECTGCMRMRPSDDELSYDFVPVIAVQRTVHMVESFVTPGLWYLNKWANRCREEMR